MLLYPREYPEVPPEDSTVLQGEYVGRKGTCGRGGTEGVLGTGSSPLDTVRELG